MRTTIHLPSYCLVSALVLIASATIPTMIRAESAKYLLRGVQIIDGTGAPASAPSDILVEGNRIAQITPTGKIKSADGKVYDYTNKYVIPGLIAAHGHVGQVNGLENGSINYNRENILRQLKQYEAYGVTTVASLGLNAPLFYELREELHSGKLPGADLFGADRGIGVAGGAPPAPALKINDDQIDRPETPEQARAAVQAAKQRSADLIKFWLDDFQGSLPVKMKPEVFTAVIDEAHQQGLRVAAHVFYLDDAKALAKAGVDVLAHGIRDQLVDQELIHLLKEKSIIYIPTIGVDESNYAFAENPTWLSDEFARRSLQPAVLEQLSDNAWRQRTLASPNLAKWHQNVRLNKQNVGTLNKAGVIIAFGADSGANPLRIPGFAEHRELQLMTEAGLKPSEAITAATQNAASALGLSDRGTITVGKLADMVVLDADPTADISNSRKIHAVWHQGKPVRGAISTFSP